MQCRHCGNDLSKKAKAFCNNGCKSEYQKLQPKLIFDQTKQYRSKIDGKCFSLGAKQSGQLKKYSKNTINKEFEWDDWEIIDVPVNTDDRWNCPHCGWSGKTKDGKDNGGWVGKHLFQNHNITKDKHIEQFPNDNLWSHSLKKIERVKTMNEHTDNRIECLECNEFFAKISNTHLKDKHDMTTDDYRAKHGIHNLSSVQTRKKLSKLYFENNKLLDNNYSSKGQIEIKEFLESYGFKIKIRRLDRVELDIFIPELNIAIEYNGLYWHSELLGKKHKLYHLNKTEYCEKNNIHLIHIFEDEWKHKEAIVKSRLLNILNKSSRTIYARKCQIKEVNPTDKNIFLINNHLQGEDNSSYKFGLYCGNELVSLMTFRTPQISMGYKNVENVMELSRFCNIKNTNVIGSASRLFKYALTNINCDRVISYADRRWTTTLNKSIYDVLDFANNGITGPNYWYMKRYLSRLPRYDFAKHKLSNKFSNYDGAKTEWENMINFGYDRIWDCGSIRYMFDKR